MSYIRGDDVFPAGAPPRSCIICGQYERGRGFRMGFAKTSHGRKHVRDGSAREILRYGTYEFVLTDAGVIVAEKLRLALRCGECGRAIPQHTASCNKALIARFNRRAERRRT